MSDTDYDEKDKRGFEKAKNVATDTAGHKSPDDSLTGGESGENLDKTDSKDTDDAKGANDAFADAKKRS